MVIFHSLDAELVKKNTSEEVFWQKTLIWGKQSKPGDMLGL